MIFGEDFGQLASCGEYEVYKSGTTIEQLNAAIASLSDEEYLDSRLVIYTNSLDNYFVHFPALMSATRRYVAINGNSTANIIYNQYWQNGVLTLLVKLITSGSLDVRTLSTDGSGATLLTITSWKLYRRQKGYDVANGGSNVAYAIAPVQTSLSSADKNYAVGEQFLYDGHLYKVTAAITSGAQIVIGTNAVAAGSITQQLYTSEIKTESMNIDSNSNLIFSSNMCVLSASVRFSGDGYFYPIILQNSTNQTFSNWYLNRTGVPTKLPINTTVTVSYKCMKQIA